MTGRGLLGLVLAFGLFSCAMPLFTPRPTPPVVWPERHVSASAITEIRQEHTACFGACPVYSVSLRRDGGAVYNGRAYLPVLGRYAGSVDSATFDRLAEYLVRHGFFRLAPYYAEPSTDLPSTITTAFFDGDSAFVIRYGMAGPESLRDIEDQIDSVASRLRWAAR